jgi:cytochrome b561
MATDPLETSQALQGSERYGSGAVAFHWAMFVLVVIVGVLGLLHDDWPKQTQGFWINLHALIGLLLWFVLIARFWWRSRHVPPALPLSVGGFARRFSGPVHLTLYALLFITPILGFVTFIYHGRIFDFGLFRIDFGVKKNQSIFGGHPRLSGVCTFRTRGRARVGRTMASVLFARRSARANVAIRDTSVEVRASRQFSGYPLAALLGHTPRQGR